MGCVPGVGGREGNYYYISEPLLFPFSFQGLGNGLIKVGTALSHSVPIHSQESFHLQELFIPQL